MLDLTHLLTQPSDNGTIQAHHKCEVKQMPEFPDLDPEQEHTPESLEATLHEYAAAVRSEFELAEKAASGNPEENAEGFAIDFAKKNMANALAQVAWLSNNSTSDAVRLNASKYLIDVAREDAKKDGDPLKELLSKIKKKPEEAASSN